MIHSSLSSNPQIILEGKPSLPSTRRSTAITCFSCGRFHEAAEAAALLSLRPPVSKVDTISLVCHTEKLNPPLSPRKQLGIFSTWPLASWLPCCLNIRSHPQARDLSPPEAVTPI